MRRFTLRFAFLALIVNLAALNSLAGSDQPQELNDRQRDDARQILHDTIDAVKKNYYDVQFHGIDLDAREKQAEQRIGQSKTFGDAFAAVAWSLDALNDSHTFFLPPSRPYEVENGWQMEFVGDKCFIVAVKPGSDAAEKGLKPGDQVLQIEGFQPERQSLWKLRYVLNTLAPRSGMKFVVASPNAQARTLEVMAKVQRLNQNLDFTGAHGDNDLWQTIRREENYERLDKWRWVENEQSDVMILKIPSFFADDSQIDGVISRARKHKSLIVDLRSDPGGSVEVLDHLLGGMFQHDVKICERVSRKDRKPQMAKGRGDHAFTGNLIVLIDSGSASAAELFARTVQLENRGLVVGDRSSGAVMENRVYPQHLGANTIIAYGVEITSADLVMSDGKSLEHNGVKPDEVILPTGADLAADRDPQMALALALVGSKVTPEEAGKFFPVEWRMR